MDRFTKFAWGVLGFNLLVILWGGFVSASGAGDGCGASWPLCAADAAAHVTPLDTFIELFHRLTSGVALLLVLGLLIWARRRYAPGHLVRRAAWFAMIFMLGEAAIGALIVLFRLVAENQSLARAFTQPLHLLNTYALLAALGLTAYWAGDPSPPIYNRALRRPLLIALVGVLLISAFGTIASLASTIFPAQSFVEGVQQDFRPGVHYLIRLRILHPLLATVVGVYLVWLLRRVRHAAPQVEPLTFGVLLLFAVQYALGGLNAVLLAPIWLQLVHLLLSDLLWLGLIVVALRALSSPAVVAQPLALGGQT